jgi:hypothetical protein
MSGVHWTMGLFIWLGAAIGIGLAADALGGKETGVGHATVQALGTANGQALACRYFDASKTAKALLVRYAPKTRTYGALFESATNAGFVAQTRSPETCPGEMGLGARLAELAAELERVFPEGGGPMQPPDGAGS